MRIYKISYTIGDDDEDEVDKFSVDYTDENSYKIEQGYYYTLKIDPDYMIDNSYKEDLFNILYKGKVVGEEYSFRDAANLLGEMVQSGDVPDEIEIDEFKSAENRLGYTNSFNTAGYITTDGNLVNLSYDGVTRGLDHREIGGGTKGMQEYVNQGNIRMDFKSGSLDLRKEPTSSQYAVIRRFIDMKGGQVALDLNDGLGELNQDMEFYVAPSRSFSEQYRAGTSTDSIIRDIRVFFNNGFKSQFSKFL